MKITICDQRHAECGIDELISLNKCSTEVITVYTENLRVTNKITIDIVIRINFLCPFQFIYISRS
jgi:hypothetical protein